MKRNDFYKIYGFDTNFKIVADYDLIMRYILSGAKGINLNTPFVFYRMGGLSDNPNTGKAEKIKVWTKNLGPADYSETAKHKTLPFKILCQLLKVLEKSTKI